MLCNNCHSCVEDEETKSVIKDIRNHLQECWSQVFDHLIESGSLDTVHRLVLGPPYFIASGHLGRWELLKSVSLDIRSRLGLGPSCQVGPDHLNGWEHADRDSKEKQLKVSVRKWTVFIVVTILLITDGFSFLAG